MYLHADMAMKEKALAGTLHVCKKADISGASRSVTAGAEGDSFQAAVTYEYESATWS